MDYPNGISLNLAWEIMDYRNGISLNLAWEIIYCDKEEKEGLWQIYIFL